MAVNAKFDRVELEGVTRRKEDRRSVEDIR
jgi:hypothetical protein